MNRTSFCRKIAAAAVTLAAGTGLLTATGPAASAWAYRPISGTRGNVSVPNVNVGDLVMANGLTRFTLYSNSGPVAYRSPGRTGTQVVHGRYQVEQWTTNGWAVARTSPVFSGQISSTQSQLSFPAAYLQPDMARGYFRLSWLFDWNTTTGAMIGSTSVVGDLTSDHLCVTRSRLCQSSNGFVRTGGYLTNTW